MPESPQISPEQELLIRLDTKMEIFLGLFKEHKEDMQGKFSEVWLAIGELRKNTAALSDKQLTAESKQQGAGWLLKLLLTAPGLAALLAWVAQAK